MTDQSIIEGSERGSPWGKFKEQLQYWALAFDYDPLEDAHERVRSLNVEVGRLKSRIKALELRMSPPTENLD